MGKRLTVVILLALTVLLVATPVLAGGDKNRGDVGQGDVEQHQIEWDEYASQRLVQKTPFGVTRCHEEVHPVRADDPVIPAHMRTQQDARTVVARTFPVRNTVGRTCLPRRPIP